MSNEDKPKKEAGGATTRSESPGQILKDVATVQQAIVQMQQDAKRDAKKREEEARRRDAEAQRRDDEAKKRDNDIKELKDLIQQLAGGASAQTSNQPGANGNAVNLNLPPPQPPQQVPTTAPPLRAPDVRSVEKLQGSVTRDSLKTWRILWNSLADTVSLKSYPKEVQYGALLSRFSLEVVKLLEVKCKVDLDDKTQTPQEVLDKLETYLKTLEHPVRDRLQFNRRVQEEGETIHHFYMSLEELGRRASLCSKCHDHVLSVQLLGGLRDEEIRREVLTLVPFPEKVDDVLQKCLTEEMSRKDQSGFRVKDGNVRNVKNKWQKRNQSRGQDNNSNEDDEKCSNCGRTHDQDKCPASDKLCNKCNRRGHFQAVCRSRIGMIKVKKIGKTSGNRENIDLPVRGLVHSVPDSESAPQVEVTVESGHGRPQHIKVLPDTGADVCIAGMRIARRCNITHKRMEKSNFNIESANRAFNIAGKKNLKYSFDGKEVTATTVICRDFEGLALSWKVAEDLGIIRYHPAVKSRILSVKKQESVPVNQTSEEIEEYKKHKKKLLTEFDDVFNSQDKIELPPQKCKPMSVIHKEDAEQIDFKQLRKEVRRLQSPVRTPTDAPVRLVEEEGASDHFMVQTMEKWIKSVALIDTEYQDLIIAIETDFPEKSRKNPAVQAFVQFRAELQVEDGMVVYNGRVVVPGEMRREILELLHAAHQGVGKMKRRARKTVFWPSLNSDIKSTIQACNKCQASKVSQTREPDKKKKRELAAKAKEYHDRTATDLQPLSVGDHVLVQSQKTKKWDRRASIEAYRNDRSYDIIMENGNRSNRNRRYLRPDLTQAIPEKKREEKQEVQKPRRSDRKRKQTKPFQM